LLSKILIEVDRVFVGAFERIVGNDDPLQVGRERESGGVGKEAFGEIGQDLQRELL
jgi:hypothetical protein